jgi:hypothetical protein
VGASPDDTIGLFCKALAIEPPELATRSLESGEVLLWRRHTGEAARKIHIAPGRTERRRHSRKYAEGELSPDRSFYFRGPQGQLNLRAQNLMLFLQLADGVDDPTWLHHLGQGDYSRWFREEIKDEELAAEAATIEGKASVSPSESRSQIRKAVERRYTLPASPPLSNLRHRPGPGYETPEP